jgi:hypothetical protein
MQWRGRPSPLRLRFDHIRKFKFFKAIKRKEDFSDHIRIYKFSEHPKLQILIGDKPTFERGRSSLRGLDRGFLIGDLKLPLKRGRSSSMYSDRSFSHFKL